LSELPISFVIMKSRILPLCTIAVALAVLSSCQTTTEAPTVDRFAQADANHDGKLSPDEGSNYFVGIIFLSCDLNKDGKLTWEEWNVPGSGRTKAKFDEADADKDGSLSMDEALAYGRKRGAFQKEFNAADTNHDGYVTREEAQAFYASTEGPPR
jgi:hypothetical protein